MKIPIEVTGFLSNISPLLERIVELSESHCARIAEKHDGFFVYRLKTSESITEKLYKGEIGKAFESLDDLFAGTIVLASKDSVSAVIAEIEQLFTLRTRISNRVNQPTKFEYDDVHLILSIKPEKYETEGPIHQLRFEIQIKTLLQYAISKATHDLLYKGENQTTNQIRFAAQLRAMLEMAENLMGNIDVADRLVEFAENPEIELRGKIINLIKQHWEPIDRPQDMRRASITIQKYLNLADVSFEDFKCQLEKSKDILELRSVGPILSCLAILLDINKETIIRRSVKHNIFFLIPNEVEELLPILKEIPEALRVNLNCGF